MGKEHAKYAGPCGQCGWVNRAEDRSPKGLCLGEASCAERAAMNKQGRPRLSNCRCEAWPCGCACHGIRQQHAPVVGVCRVCGCTDEEACEGGCSWVEPDLCSACVDEANRAAALLSRVVAGKGDGR
jgi:hypothetical protein